MFVDDIALFYGHFSELIRKINNSEYSRAFQISKSETNRKCISSSILLSNRQKLRRTIIKESTLFPRDVVNIER